MEHVIIGTAGHVDHGKTCLINALTGIDTDRLEEEKRRGITIELGFAYLDLPDGGRAGIIDVPGHEKFIRNMLAGAGGIDLALLVVAADEGVMPQTREHIGILSLLDIQRGCVAVTKKDLVDSEWLELMLDDLQSELKGTFLENAPIVPVSSYTGEGIDTLRQTLFELVAQTRGKNIEAPFRLPIDRVFSMQGFGTVVTGTLIEGTIQEGQEVAIYPLDKKTKVRSLQVHAKDVKQAFAGQRVAVNLLNVKKEEIRRGLVLAQPGSMQISMMLDVRLRVLEDCQRTIKDGSRVHFYHGAEEVLCKVVLLQELEELLPGQESYAQLRFEQGVAAKAGDHFVVRFYSPIETIGGCLILDPCPYKHKRGNSQTLEKLRLIDTGSDQDRVEALIREQSPHFMPVDAIRLQTGLTETAFESAMRSLQEEGKIISLNSKYYLHREYVWEQGEKATGVLKAYHLEHPLKVGMKREELRGKLYPRIDTSVAEKVMDCLEREGAISCINNYCHLPKFRVQFSLEQNKLKAVILAAYQKEPFMPPEKSKLTAEQGKDKNFSRVLDYLLDEGDLVPVDNELIFSKEALEEAFKRFQALAGQTTLVTLAEFRDALGASRKYAMAILEYWDRKGITKKKDDARILC